MHGIFGLLVALAVIGLNLGIRLLLLTSRLAGYLIGRAYRRWA